jgi:protein-tyrosine phosphatase
MDSRVAKLADEIQNGRLQKKQLEDLSAQLKAQIRTDPSAGKEYGALIAMISWALKQAKLSAGVNWVKVNEGGLAIGHKPGGKVSFEGLKKESADAVLTLLQGNEGALEIGDKVKRSGMKWIWFPFSASRPHEGDELIKVIDLYSQLAILLSGGDKIYIHCSAGIHRTGMITYGLLRFMGFDATIAKALLHQLRPVTAEQVGEERLHWGDQFHFR